MRRERTGNWKSLEKVKTLRFSPKMMSSPVLRVALERLRLRLLQVAAQEQMLSLLAPWAEPSSLRIHSTVTASALTLNSTNWQLLPKAFLSTALRQLLQANWPSPTAKCQLESASMHYFICLIWQMPFSCSLWLNCILSCQTAKMQSALVGAFS